jgi:hypothetical protein
MSKYEVFIERNEEGSSQDVKTCSAKSMKELEVLYTLASNPRLVLKAIEAANQETNPPVAVRKLLRKIENAVKKLERNQRADRRIRSGS